MIKLGLLILGVRLMAGQHTLNVLVEVRILHPQLKNSALEFFILNIQVTVAVLGFLQRSVNKPA